MYNILIFEDISMKINQFGGFIEVFISWPVFLLTILFSNYLMLWIKLKELP